MAWIILVLLFVVPSVIGVTVFGWVALAQIRRSKGRLYGLRLALFDGLVFPLLILDGLFAIPWNFVAGLLRTWLTAGDEPLSPAAQIFLDHRLGLIVLATVLTSLIVDFFIVRAVWRAVRLPLTPSLIPDAAPPKRRKLIGAGIALLLCLPLSGAGAVLYAWVAPRTYQATVTLQIPSDNLAELQNLAQQIAKFGPGASWAAIPRTGLYRLSVEDHDPQQAANRANSWAQSLQSSNRRILILEKAEPVIQPHGPNLGRVVILSLTAGGLLAALGLILLIVGFAQTKSALPPPATSSGHARLALWMLLLALLGPPVLLALSPSGEAALIFGALALLLALVFGILGSPARLARGVVITVLALLIIVIGGFPILVYLRQNEAMVAARRAEERAQMEMTTRATAAARQKNEEEKQLAELRHMPPGILPSEVAARQAIDEHLKAASIRYETMSFGLDKSSDLIASFSGLEELRGEDGQNVWRSIGGRLNLHTTDRRLWQVTGTEALGHLQFTLDTPTGIGGIAPVSPVASAPPGPLVWSKAQAHLLDLELQLGVAYATLPATHLQVRELEQELIAEQKQNPGSYDAAFWGLVQQKRESLTAEREELLRTGYAADHPKVQAVQQQIDATTGLIAQRQSWSRQTEASPLPQSETAEAKKRHEDQEHLLDLELKCLELSMVYLSANPKMAAGEAALAALEKEHPGLHDAAFWNLAEQRRAQFAAEHDRLIGAGLAEDHPRMKVVQEQLDLLTKLLAQRPIDLAALPGIGAHFKVAPYLKAAVYLQALGEKRAGEILLHTAQANRESESVLVLCRMLFVVKEGGEFRRPALGGPQFCGAMTMADWPLEPIAVIDGVPFLIVRGYALAGQPEPPSVYVQYCIEQCAWSAVHYAEVPPAQAAKSLAKLLSETPWKKQPLEERDRKFLTDQIEP